MRWGDGEMGRWEVRKITRERGDTGTREKRIGRYRAVPTE
jgi:hypothetical protein